MNQALSHTLAPPCLLETKGFQLETELKMYNETEYYFGDNQTIKLYEVIRETPQQLFKAQKEFIMHYYHQVGDKTECDFIPLFTSSSARATKIEEDINIFFEKWSSDDPEKNDIKRLPMEERYIMSYFPVGPHICKVDGKKTFRVEEVDRKVTEKARAVLLKQRPDTIAASDRIVGGLLRSVARVGYPGAAKYVMGEDEQENSIK